MGHKAQKSVGKMRQPEVKGRKSKRNRYSQECVIEGREYPSLFALAIDFELNYGWLCTKLKENGGECMVRGYRIALKDKKKEKKNE